jgi:TPR repeat protein
VLRQAAGNGDADAAHRFAEILETGRDTTFGSRRPVDLAEAERYYLIACDLGHVGARVHLGLMLAGAGRPEEAEAHFLVAAEQGSGVASRHLGEAAQRAGRDQDAERYLRMAAKGDNGRETRLRSLTS